jgi:hypothetical protein
MHRHHTDTQSRHWLTSPEFPQPEELMAEYPAELPAGPSDNNPPDKNAYLEFQYAMNRFEGTELLRQAIKNFRERPLKEDSDDFYVYTQVGFLLVFCIIRLTAEGTRPGISTCKNRARLSNLLFD